MRQAYDYWQDQPGSYLNSFSSYKVTRCNKSNTEFAFHNNNDRYTFVLCFKTKYTSITNTIVVCTFTSNLLKPHKDWQSSYIFFARIITKKHLKHIVSFIPKYTKTWQWCHRKICPSVWLYNCIQKWIRQITSNQRTLIIHSLYENKITSNVHIYS